MSNSRRDFLRTGLSLGALLALRGASYGGDASAAAPVAGKPRGLLFEAEDLPRIRANVRRPEFAVFQRYLTSVDFADDGKFLNEQLKLNNHVVDMGRAQNILMRSAFAHVLAPDPRHLALARAALAKLLLYPRWDWLRNSQGQPVAVMRGAGACIALALVAEWLAADLSAAEQDAITQGLATEGGPSCYRGLYDMTHHDEAGPWSLEPNEDGIVTFGVAHWPRILNDTNLRIICTTGLAAAACHLQGRHPDVPQWLDLTRDSLRRYASWQPKDGSFGEGCGYWDFTFSHYILTLELLRRRFGVDDRGLVDFPAGARYTLEMTMPTAGHPDDCISIGDAAVSASAVPLAWIAREFRDTTAQELTLRPEAIRAGWISALAAVWFDPTVPARLGADVRLDRRQALGIVISRTGWTDQDTVVTLRSGNPVNHEHADRNSVILAAHGERLLNDPVHASYSPREPKWLLRQTEAHTAVLIDGQGHIYHDGHDGTNSSLARAIIQDYRVGPGWMTVTSDVADAFRRAGLPVELVQRTLIHLKPDVVVIFDRVLLSQARPVQARFQACNDDGAAQVAVDGQAFTIERPNATLRARVASGGSHTLAAGSLALPSASGIYPFVELRSERALAHTLLTVCTAAPRGEAHGEISLARDGHTWRLAGSHRGQHVQVALSAEGNGAPEIRL